jgi:outer membrane protein assembly factor BamB
MLKPLILAGLLAACGAHRHPVSRQLKAEQSVDSVDVAPAAVTIAPWYHRQARWTGTPMSARPAVRWTKDLGGPVHHPITTNGTHLFAVSSGAVHCFSADGTLQWRTEANADGAVLPHETGLFVPTGFGVMQVLDPLSGAIVASHGGQAPIQSIPLLLGNSLAWVDRNGAIVTPQSISTPALDGPASDAASNGQRIVVGNARGEVVGASHGGPHWIQQLPGPIVAHPVVDEDRAYVAFGINDGQPGGIAAIRIDDGSLIWITHLRYGPGAAPALGTHLVVPSREAELVALDRNHGGIRWRSPGPTVFTIQPAVVGDAIYAGDAEGRVHRVDMADGGTAWSLELGTAITGAPAIIGDILAVGTADGRIVALAAP